MALRQAQGGRHSECLESGTVILECKDGRPFDKLRNNEALEKEDVMEVRNLGI